MPHLNELKTRKELGTTCSRQDPHPCTTPADWVVRIALRDGEAGLRHIDVLSCTDHLHAQRQEDPAAIVDVHPYTGPGGDWQQGRDKPFTPLRETLEHPAVLTEETP